jgi:vacuolar-type H+-ATPase subunit E/Vma4
MSVAEIVREIDTVTAADIERVLAEADVRAREILEQAGAVVRARVETAVVRAEPAIRAETARRTNLARQRVRERRAELALTTTVAVRAAALARLDAIACGDEPERWADSLQRLLDEALALVGPGATIHVRGCDAGIIAARVQAMDGCLELLAADSPAGILARAADGRIEVDATIDVRLDRAHARLAECLARTLGLGA